MATNQPASEIPNPSITDQPELPRLLRALRRNRGSAIFFARCNTRVLRDRLMATAREQLDKPVVVVHIVADPEEQIDAQIQRAIAGSADSVVFVVDLELYLSALDVSRQQWVLEELNWRRGAFERLGRSLVFWLPDFALNLLAREAPDFFDWRSGVYEFGGIVEAPSRGLLDYSPTEKYRLLSLDVAEKRRRIDSLESLIQGAVRGGVDDRDVADFKDDLALLLAQQGDVKRALGLWQESLRLDEQTGNVQGKAATLSNMASVLAQQGEINHALQLWQDSLKLKEQIGDVQGKAATLHQVAGVIAQQGDIERALKLWQRSLELLEQIDNVQGKAATLHNMAGVVAQQGDIERALKLWQESLELDEQIGNVQGKAATLHQIAEVIAKQGDVRRALELWGDSLKLKEQIGDVHGKAATLAQMAWLANRQGDLERAREYYLEAARSLSAIHAWLDLSTVLTNLGTLGEDGQAGNSAYLAQAFWLCLVTGVPLQDAVGIAGVLLMRLGPEHTAAPFLATAALLLVAQRGRDHPELQNLQQQSSKMVDACAAARDIPVDKFPDWFSNERLNDPDHVIPAVQQALVDIVGDTEWLFDPRELAARES